jgi:hypothetical protein
MGILTRQQGVQFIISSDQELDQKGAKRAPRIQSDVYRVWTGFDWSTNQSDALSFDSLDDADEYVRANYNKVVGW